MKLKLALLAGAAAPAGALYGAPRPVQIIPSVLPADFAALGLDCTALEKAGCDRIQFDVMDGNFVPNLTFGPDVIAAQRKTTKLMFETQLMVSERCTDAMLPQFTEATKGPNGEPGVVIVHVEACTHIHRSLSNIRAMGGSPSVALNPSTPAEAVENVLDLVDHVLVMTVNPGFGGQAYIPTMTDKIARSVWKSTTRQFFTKSFLGNDAAVLVRSSGEEPASPRHRAGVASTAWRTTRRFSTNAP